MTEKRAELLLAAVISAHAGVAVLGVALLTVQTGGFTGGVGYGLLAALLYAAAIIATDRFSHHDDPLTVGIVQVGVLGLLARNGPACSAPSAPPAPRCSARCCSTKRSRCWVRLASC